MESGETHPASHSRRRPENRPDTLRTTSEVVSWVFFHPGATGRGAPGHPGARGGGRWRYDTTTGIFPIRACHSFGPVWCTDSPAESTATVTGMSCTSNS